MNAPVERQGEGVVLRAPPRRRSFWAWAAAGVLLAAAEGVLRRVLGGDPWVEGLAVFGLAVLLAAWAWQRRLETFTLTEDGIRQRRPGLDRRLAWSDVARAELDDDRAFLLHAVDGSTLRVPLDLTGIDDLAGALRRHVPSGISARPAAELQGRMAGAS